MKKNYFLVILGLVSIFQIENVVAQNPGLLISEFLQNPGGTDSPYEYVELLATDDIDFTVTPYTVIVSNNGTATVDGWVAGGSLTYAFEISTGSVNVGDVVYVGGSLMSPVGTQLRTIDTGIQGGDGGIGDANSSGVIGNGGGNADGIAVFNLPAISITASTVPTDAVIFGTGIGSAEVNGGADGYELPINDLYNGGKLNSSSTFVIDADLTVATGMFDLTTNTFAVPRTFQSGAATETSEITFGSSAPVQIGFDVNNLTINESAGTITIDITPLNVSSEVASFDVAIASYSTAETTIDYTITSMSYTIPSGQTNSIEIEITILEDLIEEQSEYFTLSFTNLVNAEINGNASATIYITDNDRVVPSATNELKLELITSFSNGAEGSSSAEITAYDSESSKLFIANSVANNIDFVDFQNPASPVIELSFNVDSIGAVNSIASLDGVVIVALENLNPQQNGFLLFLDSDGQWLNRIEVGPMPDMVTYNHAKTKILVANEGEPNSDYDVDPEGSIAVIDYNGDPTSLTASNVDILNFNNYDGQEESLRDQGIRIFGPGASASQDFEPEYITVTEDDLFAYVSLQENNALAVVDLTTNSITDILPLGTIDHSLFGFGMDVSNETDGINIANFPVKGMFMPDAISSITIDNSTYVLTANEGDARDYDGYSEESRIKDLNLDPTIFPEAELLQQDEVLGRLNTTLANGDDDENGLYEEIYTYGTRSFSIWNDQGELIFDSGDLFEQIIANDPVFVDLFNASNTGLSQKNRSDDKGPEPEGVETAYINGIPFAFVSLERIGGVMLFNISNPAAPVYLGYYNNRDIATNGPDKGAEGLLYIDSENSPNGKALLILSNEVSSSLSVYEIESCLELSTLSISSSNENNSFCEGTSIELTASSTAELDYQWTLDGSEIQDATENSLETSESGLFTLMFENDSENCSGTTEGIEITELPSPTPTISSQSDVLSTEEYVTYTWYYENDEIEDATEQSINATNNGSYTVIVTDENGCQGESAPFIVEGLSIDESQIMNYSVYPNPANQFIEIVGAENFTATVISINGDSVATSTSTNNTCWINVEALPNGIYFIQLMNQSRTENIKLVVAH